MYVYLCGYVGQEGGRGRGGRYRGKQGEVERKGEFCAEIQKQLEKESVNVGWELGSLRGRFVEGRGGRGRFRIFRKGENRVKKGGVKGRVKHSNSCCQKVNEEQTKNA